MSSEADEIVQGADFIEFIPSDSEEEKHEMLTWTVDENTGERVLKLLSSKLREDSDYVVLCDQDIIQMEKQVTQNISMVDLIREDTIGQPIPEYIAQEINNATDESMMDIIEISDEEEEEEIIEISSDEENDFAQSRKALKQTKLPQSLTGNCEQCKIPFNVRNRLSFLEKVRGRVLCLGCERLFDCVSCKEELHDMIQWLATGRYPEYDRPFQYSTQEASRRFDDRMRSIAIRKKRKVRGSATIPDITAEDLMKIYINSNGICPISGNQLFFHSRRFAYWSLTFDHIEPIYNSRNDASIHTKDNLQVMCKCLNTVKGHYSDRELKEWYSYFLNSIRIVVE